MMAGMTGDGDEFPGPPVPVATPLLVEVVELDNVPLPYTYKLSLLGPPQYSVWLLLHIIEQSPLEALVEPDPREFPQ